MQDVLGGPFGADERTVPFGEALVWALDRGDHVVAWLKRHRVKDKARRERHAYEAWAPAIGWGTAPWLGACPAAPAWTMTGAVAGVRADRAVLDADERRALYRELGRFLAALHAVPHVDRDRVTVEDALHARVTSWAGRGEGRVDDDVLHGVLAAFETPVPHLPRVPCHRDLGLHNALVEVRPGGDVALTVIDFGQARADLAMADLVKLFQRPDEVLPSDTDAFFEGYGRRLTPEEADLLERLRALHGLATWVWAAEHGDAVGIRIGRRILERSLLLLDV